jgi:hypothetical protein
LLALESFEHRNRPPALRFERRKLFELGRQVDAAASQPLSDDFDVFSQERRVKHVGD